MGLNCIQDDGAEEAERSPLPQALNSRQIKERGQADHCDGEHSKNKITQQEVNSFNRLR